MNRQMHISPLSSPKSMMKVSTPKTKAMANYKLKCVPTRMACHHGCRKA